MSDGKLQKLVIRCFKDEKYEIEITDLKYTALLNPEKYLKPIKPNTKRASLWKQFNSSEVYQIVASRS